jgi:hypothetical protein
VGQPELGNASGNPGASHARGQAATLGDRSPPDRGRLEVSTERRTEALERGVHLVPRGLALVG